MLCLITSINDVVDVQHC